ncbi:MAG TPA: 50S ribosomal protein L28 [Chloroflexi bacterium]|nr:50S ribosomal protein L28 [Chloroflexota bacterium]
MAVCEICGKKPQFGHNVSHSMRHTKRKFKPNIQTVRIMRNGRMVRVKACAKCIKTLDKDVKIKK